MFVSGIEQYFETHDFQPHIIVSADVFVYIGDISKIFNAASKSLLEEGIFVFSTEDTMDTEQFILKDSGRFAHNETYLQSLPDLTYLNSIYVNKPTIKYRKFLWKIS